ncbi:DUF3515 domain-containing protein [Agromyces sp. NPDC127015]|uniref:DUF3515 domain-containing protein n=1 Tax=Agromyces sp. NPDC127015 TaxID=3347108 RepID=UPI00364FFB5C
MDHPNARLRRARLPLVAACSAALAISLTACSQPVPIDPADEASSPDCAAVVVRLPDVLAKGTGEEQAERETNAQGTGAWGSPASVLLRCGVEPPGPTTDRCVTVNGVDWIIDETDAPNYRFTTYGRTPAVEVLVDNDVVSGTTAITELSSAVSVIPSETECTSVDDATTAPGTDG